LLAVRSIQLVSRLGAIAPVCPSLFLRLDRRDALKTQPLHLKSVLLVFTRFAFTRATCTATRRRERAAALRARHQPRGWRRAGEAGGGGVLAAHPQPQAVGGHGEGRPGGAWGGGSASEVCVGGERCKRWLCRPPPPPPRPHPLEPTNCKYCIETSHRKTVNRFAAVALRRLQPSTTYRTDVMTKRFVNV
jgi:hypothetical protein